MNPSPSTCRLRDDPRAQAGWTCTDNYKLQQPRLCEAECGHEITNIFVIEHPEYGTLHCGGNCAWRMETGEVLRGGSPRGGSLSERDYRAGVKARLRRGIQVGGAGWWTATAHKHRLGEPGWFLEVCQHPEGTATSATYKLLSYPTLAECRARAAQIAAGDFHEEIGADIRELLAQRIEQPGNWRPTKKGNLKFRDGDDLYIAAQIRPTSLVTYWRMSKLSSATKAWESSQDFYPTFGDLCLEVAKDVRELSARWSRDAPATQRAERNQ